MNGRRIDTVLRVRALRERIARTEVAQQRQSLDGHRRAEVEAWQAVQARSEAPVSDPRHFVAHRSMLRAGVTEAGSARNKVRVAGERVDHAVADWQDAARHLDGIERLAERLRAEMLADTDRRAANELDDLVVMRHGSEVAP